MRKYLLAAVAAAAISTPAFAQDTGGYFGVEGGVLFPKDQNIDGRVDFTNTAVPDLPATAVGGVDFNRGVDMDVIGGFDLGMFRIEGELGYKRAKADNIKVDNAFLTAFNTGAGTAFTDEDFDLNGKARVWSLMVNGLLDFGDDRFGAYVGGGFGRAWVKEFGDSDKAWAWQLIAGVRTAVSDNIDVGLKYRYFHTGKLDFDNDFAFTGVGAGSGGTAFFNADNHFSSHSLLASLIFNFGATEAAPPPAPPPPPPPPAPVAPATQTCPDGSVIAATDVCPAPPPPPPPPPAPSPGERG